MREFLKWTGIVLGGLFAWLVLMVMAVIWTGFPLFGLPQTGIIMLAIVVTVIWLATTGRLGWMGKKQG